MALDKLIPFHKTHSISEVSLNLYLANTIIQPERFKKLLETGLKGLFDEFRVAYQQGVQVKFSGAGDPEIDFPEKKITGFRFNKFKEGKVAWVIQASNESQNSKDFSVLSFHCLDAEYDWDIFLPEIKKYIEHILTFEPSFFVKAIGLNYIDQFNWISEKYPDFSEIFKLNSEFLPKLFFRKSDDFTFAFNGKCSDHLDALPFIEKIDIFSRTISKGNINIGLVHLIVKEWKDVTSLNDLIAQNLFDESLNWAHNKNKDFLKQVLSQEVIEKIGLN
jgi:uncharacterized protein (TIGR04255 family)